MAIVPSCQPVAVMLSRATSLAKQPVRAASSDMYAAAPRSSADQNPAVCERCICQLHTAQIRPEVKLAKWSKTQPQFHCSIHRLLEGGQGRNRPAALSLSYCSCIQLDSPAATILCTYSSITDPAARWCASQPNSDFIR